MSINKKHELPDYRRMSSFYATPKSLVHKRRSLELVPIVRKQVLQMYEFDKQLYDECDINRILTNDWSVQRFVEYYQNNAEESTKQLIATLKWRKSFGVNTRSLEDCPLEFFNIGALVPYNEDRNGVPLIYMRAKCNRKIPKLLPLIEMFFITVIESVDKEAEHHGFALVLDCSDTGISNVSTDLLKFVITSLTTHYPLGIQYCLVYNLPWILRGIWYLIKGWLGDYQKYVRFANGDQICDFVDSKALPQYLGGKCEKSFTKAPDSCPTIYDLAEKYGLTHKEINRNMKLFEGLILEAKSFDN